MEKPILIKSVRHLYEILDHSENLREFFIQLPCTARSWKQITLINKTDRYGRSKFKIHNEADGTTQTLTIHSLLGSAHSNIASAIRCKSFYLFDNNENHDGSDVKFYEKSSQTI